MGRKSMTPVSTEIEADVGALRLELSEASAEAERLSDGRRPLLLNGTDAELEEHDRQLAAAGRRRDRAGAKLEVAEVTLADAQAREAAEGRAQRVAEADRAAAAASEAITAWHAHVAAATFGMLREVAEADILVAAANAERTADDPGVMRTEARVRDVPGVPAEFVSERVVEKWCFSETGNVLSEETAARVVSGDGRNGTISAGAMSLSAIRVEQRSFVERRVLPALPARFSFGHSFAQSIVLPGLRADDPPVWSPMSSDSPEAILARLAALDIEPERPAVDREVQIELLPLPDRAVAEAAE